VSERIALYTLGKSSQPKLVNASRRKGIPKEFSGIAWRSEVNIYQPEGRCEQGSSLRSMYKYIKIDIEMNRIGAGNGLT